VIGTCAQRNLSHYQYITEIHIAEFGLADCLQVKITIERSGIDTKSMVEDSVLTLATSMPNRGPHRLRRQVQISASRAHRQGHHLPVRGPDPIHLTVMSSNVQPSAESSFDSRRPLILVTHEVMSTLVSPRWESGQAAPLA
jgi:hypothetical protein